MAGASRPVVAGDSLLVFPKTWRWRLAVRGAGVADRDERMSSEVRRPASSHLLLALTWSMSLRWSLCSQPTLGHQGNLSSCQLDYPQLPTEILTYGHPKLDGWHPGRPRRDGAGAGGVVRPLLHAVARLLRPTQVDDVRCPLLPPLPTGARHSRALVCTVGPAAWRLRPSAGTGGCGGRLEGAGRAQSCGL